jgi:hypothetical protein
MYACELRNFGTKSCIHLPLLNKKRNLMSTKKYIFFKSLYTLFFVIFLGCLIFARAGKSKSEFQKVTGRLISIEKTSKSLPNQDTAKMRYLLIDNHPKIFQIFIGKEFGDFKPKFEKIDSLRANDDITIYFDENFKTQNDPINRLTYFIDRGQETIFIKGDWEKNAGIFLIGLCVAIIVILIILKQKGKIA